MNRTPVSSNNLRISARQAMLLLITYVLSTADVLLPAFVAQEAREDSWIAVIAGTAGALVIVNVFVTLGLRYPTKTLTQYAGDIVGKPLGKAVGLLYAYMFLFIAWSVTRELEEIFVVSFNPEAPIFLFGIMTVAVAYFAVIKGIEVIARINEILLPVGIVILLAIALLNAPKMNFSYFLPIFYDGVVPSLKGGIMVQTWLIETVVLLFLMPYIEQKEQIRKIANIAVVALGASLMVGVMIIAVFGVALTSKLLFPALEFVRYAEIGNYIQNLDILIMVVWISGIFVKIALSYYVGTLALAQVVGARCYKTLALPIGTVIVVMSSAAARVMPEIIFTLKYILPFYFIVMCLIVPALLLTVSLIRKQKT